MTDADVAKRLGMSLQSLRVAAACGMPGAPSGLAWRVSSQADVARYCGISRRTVSDWMKQGCPGGGRDGYCLIAVLRWRRERDDGADFQPGGVELPDRRPTGDLVRGLAHAQMLAVGRALERLAESVSPEVADRVELELSECFLTVEQTEQVISELWSLV